VFADPPTWTYNRLVGQVIFPSWQTPPLTVSDKSPFWHLDLPLSMTRTRESVGGLDLGGWATVDRKEAQAVMTSTPSSTSNGGFHFSPREISHYPGSGNEILQIASQDSGQLFSIIHRRNP
jgi:hypothetical protein